jgi:NAD(P)H-flavin reductase
VVRFAKHDPGVQAFFTKGPGEEVVTITYNDTEKQLIATTKTKLDELVDTITSSTTDCEGFDGSKFSECVTEGIMKEISKTTNSKALMSAYRDVMSRRLVRYICEDDQLIVSNVSSTSNFVDGQMKVYIMNNLLDTTHGKIFYIENFLSENDCATIQDYHENKVSSVSDGVSTTYFDLFEADKNHPIK